jgi:hypothetical protein
MDWATFWAIFSQTHLVTLLAPSSFTRVIANVEGFAEEHNSKLVSSRVFCFPEKP